jgi:hypothetical protein
MDNLAAERNLVLLCAAVDRQATIRRPFIMDALVEESTEDVQKFGGMQALDQGYMDFSFRQMIKKRGGWLAALFMSEMLTASGPWLARPLSAAVRLEGIELRSRQRLGALRRNPCRRIRDRDLFQHRPLLSDWDSPSTGVGHRHVLENSQGDAYMK